MTESDRDIKPASSISIRND